MINTPQEKYVLDKLNKVANLAVEEIKDRRVSHSDGRIESAAFEDEMIEILSSKFTDDRYTLKKSKDRDFADYTVESDDSVMFFNVKQTNGKKKNTYDNASCKVAIVIAFDRSVNNLSNEDRAAILDEVHLREKNFHDYLIKSFGLVSGNNPNRGSDYYFQIFDKTTSKFKMSSLRSITSSTIKVNYKNAPFQVSFSNMPSIEDANRDYDKSWRLIWDTTYQSYFGNIENRVKISNALRNKFEGFSYGCN